MLLYVLSESRRFSIVRRDRSNTVPATRERAVEPVGKTCQRYRCVRESQPPARAYAWGPWSPSSPLVAKPSSVRRTPGRARGKNERTKKEQAKTKSNSKRHAKQNCAINCEKKNKKKQTRNLVFFILSFSLFLGGLVCVYRTRSAPIYHCTSVLCAMRTTSGHSGWWTTPSS